MSSQNVSTTLVYMAYNTSTGAYQTGDVSNHTLKLVKDGTEASPTNSASEVDSTNAPGAYKLTLTAAETQFGTVWLGGKSSTANVIIVPITVSFEILPTALDGNGMVKADVEDIAGTTLSTHASGMIPADLRDISGSAVSTSSAQLGVNTVNIAGHAATLDGNNLLEVDVVDIAGSAVNTSSAQLGVNVVTPTIPTFPTNFSSMSITSGGSVSIASNVKKNQALNAFPFTMTNSTTHAPQTGLTVTATRSLDGNGFSSCANSVTEISNGDYYINLANTDLNANCVILRLTATGADDLNIVIITQP